MKKAADGIFRFDDACMRLNYLPPYNFSSLLKFFRDRALPGVESIGENFYSRTARIEGSDGKVVCGWIRVEDDVAHNQLVVSVSESLVPHAPEVARRLRRMFDTDCDPESMAEGLSPARESLRGYEFAGTRLPGCFDPFETACRAVLGQQISVSAACKLASRIVESHGHEIDTGIEGLDRVWPTPKTILALEPIEDALGALGVIRTRSRVISDIARKTINGQLDLSPKANIEKQMESLISIKGIGPWTAGYIAMRALGHADAFLETDAGVAHALPDLSPKERLAFAESCRPWRSYLVMSLWNSLG